MLTAGVMVALVIFIVVVFTLFFTMFRSGTSTGALERFTPAGFKPSPEYERKKWADDGSLFYATKCVSCERLFPLGERWRGQPTKCFSCEAHAQRHPEFAVTPQHTHPLPAYVSM